MKSEADIKIQEIMKRVVSRTNEVLREGEGGSPPVDEEEATQEEEEEEDSDAAEEVPNQGKIKTTNKHTIKAAPYKQTNQSVGGSFTLHSILFV